MWTKELTSIFLRRHKLNSFHLVKHIYSRRQQIVRNFKSEIRVFQFIITCKESGVYLLLNFLKFYFS